MRTKVQFKQVLKRAFPVRLLSRLVLGLLLITTLLPLEAASAVGVFGPNWSSDSTALSATGARYDWNYRTGSNTTISRVSHSVPAGTDGAPGSRYLALNGVAGNCYRTPDSATNSLSGDIDVRTRVAVADWTTASITSFVSKWEDSGSQKGWIFYRSNNRFHFIRSTTGSDQTGVASSAGVAFSAGSTQWVRTTYQADNGAGGSTIRFYTSNDGSTWNELGIPQTISGASPIFDNAGAINIGSYNTCGNWLTTGRFYSAEIRNGIAGPIVNRFDPNEVSVSSPSSWTSSTGETWNVNRNGTNLPADIASDLTVSSVSGLGSGTASVRLIDQTAVYRVSSPTAVAAGTSVSVGLSGFKNTPTSTGHSSVITSYDNSSTPVVVDTTQTSNAVTFGTQPTDVSWSSSSSTPGAVADYSFGTRSSRTAALNKVNMTVPPGTNATGIPYASLPGVQGNYLSTPDSSANSITGDLDIKVKMKGGWKDGPLYARLLGKNGAGNNSYGLSIYTNGQIELATSNDGSTSTLRASNAVVPFSSGDTGWFRVTLDVDNGSGGATTTFYTSTDGITWTQLGGQHVGSSTTSLFDGNTDLVLGALAADGLMKADLQYVEVRNGIDGPVASRFSATDAARTPGASSWTSSTGETWTLNRTGNDPASITRDLSVVSATGVPSGGAARLNLTDNIASYRFTDTSVAAGTLANVKLGGFVNTNTGGSYSSQVTTFNNSQQGVDNSSTNNVTFGPGTATFSSDNIATGATNTRYNWSTAARSNATLSKVTATVPSGTRGSGAYLNLPGVTKNFASTPDSPANSITGDIDIRASMAATNWSMNQNIVAKSTYSGNYSYKFQIYEGGLRLSWSPDGSNNLTAQSTTTSGFTNGSRQFVRATLTVNNGSGGWNVNFFYSNDGASWSPLGSTITGSGITSVFDGSAPLELGSDTNGQSNLLNAKVYDLQLRQGIDGPVRNRFEPDRASATAHTAATGEVWTVYRSSAPEVSGSIADKRLNVNDPTTISTPDSPMNSITGDLDIRAKAAVDWSSSDYQTFVSKRNGATFSYGLRKATNSKNLNLYWSPTGSTPHSEAFSSANVPFADNTIGWVRATLDVDNGAGGWTARFFTSTDGISWTQLGTAATGPGATAIADTTAQLTVGTAPAAGSQQLRGSIYSAEVRNGIDGPVVSRFDANDIADLGTPWASVIGETWTAYRVNSPADIVAPLVVSSVSGVPSGGTAVLRVLDQQAVYSFAPTAVGSGTPISVGLTGFTNTGSYGTYNSAVVTYDNAGYPNQSDVASTSVGQYFSVAPVAVGDSATVDEDSSVVIDVLANDSDADDALVGSSVTVVSGPSNGSTSVNPSNGRITYSPAANYYGPDSFTYRICDPHSLCSTAVVSITVNSVNDPPIVVGDTGTTKANKSVTIDVLANDSDIDGTLVPSSVSVISGSAHGTTSVNTTTGAITFVPAQGYSGPDSFTYQVCDNQGACGSGVVNITVAPLSFTFGVSGRPTSCNGISPTSGSASTGSSIGLGHLAPGSNGIASQNLTIGTNADVGYVIYAKASGPFASGSSQLPAVSGTNGSPSSFPGPGTAGFGYSASKPAQFSTGLWAQLTTSNANVASVPTPVVSDSSCVSYRAGISNQTPAGNYTTSITYTAVPTF